MPAIFPPVFSPVSSVPVVWIRFHCGAGAGTGTCAGTCAGGGTGAGTCAGGGAGGGGSDLHWRSKGA